MARIEIREAELGDHGWVLERHAHLYPPGSGWDRPFIALVAQVIADYLENLDPERERAWIGEVDGRRAGAVYCTRESEDEARLRLLFVEGWARGNGLGRGLVERCLDFARERGYRRIVLWTNSSLTSARQIYDAFGFVQTTEEAHAVFPEGTIGQELRLDL